MTENKNGENNPNLLEDPAERAAQLIDSLFNRDIPEDIRVRIQDWFRSGVNEEEKYAAVEDIFNTLKENRYPDEYDERCLKELHQVLGLPSIDIAAPAKPVIRRINSKSLSRTVLRIAAVILPFIVIMGALHIWRNPVTPEPYETTGVIIAAEDAGQDIVLPDGSAVTLGANSTIAYETGFAGGRHVRLAGEALFDVMKQVSEDGERLPFTVSTGELEINVTGTVFRISGPEDADLSYVSLFSGSVNVAADGIVSELTHGEKFTYTKSTKETAISIIPADEMIGNGHMPTLRFENSSLGNLITAMEANYKVTFVIPEGTDLGKGRYSADFEGETLTDALELLSFSDNTFSFRHDGNRVIMSKK